MQQQALKVEPVEAVPEKTKFEVGGRRAKYVLIICCLLYAINWMDRQVFSVVAAPMMEALKLSKTQVGWIQNFFLLSIGLFAIPVSYLVDRWSRKKGISLMAILWSGATFVTGLGTGFTSVLIPRVGVGVGEAGFGPGGTALIGASFKPEERGHKLGIFNMFIALGIVAGLLLGGFFAQRWGWAAPFFIFAVPGVILGILALFMQDYPTRPKVETGVSFWQSFVALWKIPTLRWLYVGFGLYMLTIMAVAHWNVALLIFRFKLRVDQASLIMASILLLSLFAYPLGGWISDKWEKKRPGGRMRYAALCSLGGAVSAVLYLYVTFILVHRDFRRAGSIAHHRNFILRPAHPRYRGCRRACRRDNPDGGADASEVLVLRHRDDQHVRSGRRLGFRNRRDDRGFGWNRKAGRLAGPYLWHHGSVFGGGPGGIVLVAIGSSL